MVSRTRVVGSMARNDRTRVAPRRVPSAVDATLRAERAPEELRERWQEILERVHLWRAEHPEGDAIAVVVRQGEVFDICLQQKDASGPFAVVVGRHSQSDLVLLNDERGAASLRHACVMLWPSTTTSRARAIAVDLRSELGLMLRDGRVARRLSSTTAWSFAAGAAEVTALVASGDAPFPVRFADQLDAHLSGALVDVDERLDPRPSRAVSSWERSVVVRTRVAGLPAPAIAEDSLAIRARRLDVERGVVLGRYTRCDRTTALAEDLSVSRVHALLFSADDALWVVDTASTAGTRVIGPGGTTALGEGRRIVRMPEDARLFLGAAETLLVVDG